MCIRDSNTDKRLVVFKRDDDAVHRQVIKQEKAHDGRDQKDKQDVYKRQALSPPAQARLTGS